MYPNLEQKFQGSMEKQSVVGNRLKSTHVHKLLKCIDESVIYTC